MPSSLPLLSQPGNGAENSNPIRGHLREADTVGIGLKAKPKKADGWTIEGTLSGTFGNGKPTARIGVRATYKFCGLFASASKCQSRIGNVASTKVRIF